ncbi:MAG: helix-turn-helix domain-containing protein, partial [Clostridia bacterium]|nr:helix-turn-helix domain-containing protein [Clostridia bacterium]
NKKHQIVDSLDESVNSDNDGNDISLIETIPEDDPDKVFNSVSNTILLEQINEIMKECLNAREYYIIVNRYGLNNMPAYTQSEVAKKLKISRSYVSRIEKKAVEILKQKIYERKIYFPTES